MSKKTIEGHIKATESDVAVYHHCDGCYTVIGVAPVGIVAGDVRYTPDGQQLLCKSVVSKDTGRLIYNYEYPIHDEVLTTVPVKPKAEPDQLVDRMTKSKPKSKSKSRSK